MFEFKSRQEILERYYWLDEYERLLDKKEAGYLNFLTGQAVKETKGSMDPRFIKTHLLASLFWPVIDELNEVFERIKAIKPENIHDGNVVFGMIILMQDIRGALEKIDIIIPNDAFFKLVWLSLKRQSSTALWDRYKLENAK